MPTLLWCPQVSFYLVKRCRVDFLFACVLIAFSSLSPFLPEFVVPNWWGGGDPTIWNFL